MKNYQLSIYSEVYKIFIFSLLLVGYELGNALLYPSQTQTRKFFG